MRLVTLALGDELVLFVSVLARDEATRGEFWIANVYDAVCLLRGVIVPANEAGMGAPLLGQLLVMRTEGARLGEEHFRAWLGCLCAVLCPMAATVIMGAQTLHLAEAVRSRRAHACQAWALTYTIVDTTHTSGPKPDSVDQPCVALERVLSAMRSSRLQDDIGVQVLEHVMGSIGGG